MGRLFRDWRYALLWALGIGALAAAFASDNDSYGKQQTAVTAEPQEQTVAIPPAPKPAPVSSPQAAAEEEQGPGFGEPLMDTTPFESSPVEPGANPAAAAATAAPATAASPAAVPTSPPAPVVP